MRSSIVNHQKIRLKRIKTRKKFWKIPLLAHKIETQSVESNKMSVNTAHANGGVLIHAGET